MTRMGGAGAIILLAGIFTGPVIAAAPTTQKAKLTIATFNINWGIRQPEQLRKVVETIQESKADIVAIQEGNLAVYRFLSARLTKDYPHRRFYAGPAACGFGWLSKLPLANANLLKRKHGFFDTAMVHVTIGGRKVQLMSIHLQPIAPQPGDRLVAMVKRFGESEAIRRQEIEYIHQNIPAGMPALLLGDFNSMPMQSAPRFLREKGYIDSFASVTKDADTQYTWEWGPPEQAWRARLDYIWHSAEFKTVRSRIIPCEASDHALLVSEIES